MKKNKTSVLIKCDKIAFKCFQFRIYSFIRNFLLLLWGCLKTLLLTMSYLLNAFTYRHCKCYLRAVFFGGHKESKCFFIEGNVCFRLTHYRRISTRHVIFSLRPSEDTCRHLEHITYLHIWKWNSYWPIERNISSSTLLWRIKF